MSGTKQPTKPRRLSLKAQSRALKTHKTIGVAQKSTREEDSKQSVQHTYQPSLRTGSAVSRTPSRKRYLSNFARQRVREIRKAWLLGDYFLLFSVIARCLVSILSLLSQLVFHRGLQLKTDLGRKIDSLYGKWVEKTFGVRFIDYYHFPRDVFWRDYSQREDFMPRKGWIVIDAGASCGDWSIVVAKAFGAEKVVAIEPSPPLFSRLCKNIELNNLEHVITPLKAALWDSDSDIRLHTGFFLTVEEKGGTEKVQAKKLDSVLHDLDLGKVDLLKIDVEGSETRVLSGAISTIRHLKPKVIVEAHSAELREQVIGLLRPEGYRIVHEKVNCRRPFVSVMYFTHRESPPSPSEP